MPLYLHDAFDLNRFSNFVANRKDFVVQDHHSYFVFTPEDKAESGSQHIKDVGAIAQSFRDVSKVVRGNLIVGEWSCALTPESLSVEPDAHKTQKKFCTEQMDIYDATTAGWAFWSMYLFFTSRVAIHNNVQAIRPRIVRQTMGGALHRLLARYSLRSSDSNARMNQHTTSMPVLKDEDSWLTSPTSAANALVKAQCCCCQRPTHPNNTRNLLATLTERALP